MDGVFYFFFSLDRKEAKGQGRCDRAKNLLRFVAPKNVYYLLTAWLCL
jgi:hypothetical protein